MTSPDITSVSSKGFGRFMGLIAKTAHQNPMESSWARTALKADYGCQYVRTDRVAKAAMGEVSGSVGGYLVPVEFTTRLMKVFAEESFVYPRAFVISMSSTVMQGPVVDAQTLQGVTGVSNLFGGLRFTWGASQAPGATNPTLRQLELTAWDLLGYATLSNQMLWDGGAAGEQSLMNLFGKAAAWAAEYAFFQGLGASASQPLGIIKAPGSLLVNRKNPGQIILADIANMASQLLPASWPHAIWAASPTALAPIMTMANFRINQTPIGVSTGCMGTLAGLPVFVSDKLSALGSAGDLVLFDPEAYVIGDRSEVLIDASTHSAFQTNQTDFRVWLRMDGKPLFSAPITLADNTTKVSPYLVLN